MKLKYRKLTFAAIVAGLALSLAGCSKPAEETAARNPALDAPIPPGMVRGTVVETMNSGGYTYVLLEAGQQQHWFASRETAVSVGDVIQTEQGMPMSQFESKTLGRTFDVIFFVSALQNLSAPAASAASGPLPPGHPATGSAAGTAADVAVQELEPGKNIAWVYENRDSMAGQQVSLRGKVVKYNPNILGWNFLHVQDGSGSPADGSNDMIVTTKAQTAVGETVVLMGTVVLDKDFGAGYSYPILIEDAKLTIE